MKEIKCRYNDYFDLILKNVSEDGFVQEETRCNYIYKDSFIHKYVRHIDAFDLDKSYFEYIIFKRENKKDIIYTYIKKDVLNRVLICKEIDYINIYNYDKMEFISVKFNNNKIDLMKKHKILDYENNYIDILELSNKSLNTYRFKVINYETYKGYTNISTIDKYILNFDNLNFNDLLYFSDENINYDNLDNIFFEILNIINSDKYYNKKYYKYTYTYDDNNPNIVADESCEYIENGDFYKILFINHFGTTYHTVMDNGDYNFKVFNIKRFKNTIECDIQSISENVLFHAVYKDDTLIELYDKKLGTYITQMVHDDTRKIDIVDIKNPNLLHFSCIISDIINFNKINIYNEKYKNTIHNYYMDNVLLSSRHNNYKSNDDIIIYSESNSHISYTVKIKNDDIIISECIIDNGLEFITTKTYEPCGDYSSIIDLQSAKEYSDKCKLKNHVEVFYQILSHNNKIMLNYKQY